MATENQLRANRINAMRSTGPVSDEGKRKVGENAIKHGLLSRHLFQATEDRSEFDNFHSDIFNYLCPVGPIEEALANKIFGSLWRLKRVEKVEPNLLQQDSFFKDDSISLLNNNSSSFEVLSRYEAHLEKGFYRALHELQRIQALRNGIGTCLPVAIDLSENR